MWNLIIRLSLLVIGANRENFICRLNYVNAMIVLKVENAQQMEAVEKQMWTKES